MKKVLAACIDQILLFDSLYAFYKWEASLIAKNQIYMIKKVDHGLDGSCTVRVRKRYNNNTFLDEGGDLCE